MLFALQAQALHATPYKAMRRHGEEARISQRKEARSPIGVRHSSEMPLTVRSE